MNDATPTHTKCRPAVRLAYDISAIEETLTAFGLLEKAARASVDAIYWQSLKSIYISSQGYVYNASVQHGDFLVNFTITSNLFSATKIEYNPYEDPTDIFDGETIEILSDGDIIVLPSTPLSHTVCFLTSSEDREEYTIFSIEPTGDAAFLTCAPPDRINLENSSVLENQITVFVSDYELDEGGEILFEISLSSPVSDKIEIGYTSDFTILENGERRDTVSGSVTFEPGQTNAVVIIECERSLPDAEVHLAIDHNRPTPMGTLNDCRESTTGMEGQMIHKNWVELIKPTQLDIKPSNAPARQATIIAEPLERGFGLIINDMVTGGTRIGKAARIASGNEQPRYAYRSHTCDELRNSHIGDSVRLSGWVHRVRNQGELLFIDLRDHYGITRVIADGDSPVFAELEKVRSEWCIRIDGSVQSRDESMMNSNLPTGEVEVFIRDLEVLCALDELPLVVFGDQEHPEETRLFKYGSGTGADSSSLRAERETLYGATGFVQIIDDGSASFGGAGIDLPHGGSDAIFDGAGNAWADGDDGTLYGAARFVQGGTLSVGTLTISDNGTLSGDAGIDLTIDSGGTSFVLADDDDGSIMDLWVREARLFKYGTGTNFWSLRAGRETLSGAMGFVQIIGDGSASFGGARIDLTNGADSATANFSYTVSGGNDRTDTVAVDGVQVISDGDAIFDDAGFDLTIGNGSAVFGGMGRALVNGDEGMLSGAKAFVQINDDGSASFGGARIDLPHGGGDAVFDGAGNAWTDGAVASHGVPERVNSVEMCEGSISPADQVRSWEWATSKRLSGTYRKKLFPQQDCILHKTYIDDSVYTSYIASRSNSLGQGGEAPQQPLH